MKIEKVDTMWQGKGVFAGQWAVVHTNNGKRYQYAFEFDDTWHDMDDYLDNVRSDWGNEYEGGDDLNSDLFFDIDQPEENR
jgi:hypothetical protein